MKIQGELGISKCHGVMCSLCAHAKRKHGGYVVTLKKNGDILFIRDQKSKISECIVNNEDYFNNKSKSCNTFCPMFV